MCCKPGDWKGGFAIVRKEENVHTGQVRAVKIIDMRRMPREWDWKRELSVMATLASVKFSSKSQNLSDIDDTLAGDQCLVRDVTNFLSAIV